MNNPKKPIAVFLGASTALLSIGLIHMIAHANAAFKTAITLHSGIGPYSGKVTFGILTGIVIALAYYFLYKKETEFDAWFWTKILLASLALATLFVFTPFVELVA